ncbi:OB-fold nucleic acid binding domain-containing protein [Pyrococcus kukulkanii]|uniref:OB-fold nucleic acid binding domain-containing protein n=1 Tax=Pyrococcus kukulkanii TaxID=1609559 RepID=UPI00356A06C4
MEDGGEIVRIERVSDIPKEVPENAKAIITGRVQAVFSPKEFTRPDKTIGKFFTLLVEDETGMVRVVVWNSFVNKYHGRIQKGDIVRVITRNIKWGMRGPELHIDRLPAKIIINPELSEEELQRIPPVREFIPRDYPEMTLAEAYEFVEDPKKRFQVKATIVQLYRVVPVKARDQEIVLAVFGIDDGTDYARAIAFGDVAEQLLETNLEEVKALYEDALNALEDRRKARDFVTQKLAPRILGKEVIIKGNWRIRELPTGAKDILVRVFDFEERDYVAELEEVVA